VKAEAFASTRAPMAACYEAMLDQSSVNIRDRSAAYRKAGWSKFDTKAPPYTGEQIRRERDLYRSRAA